MDVSRLKNAFIRSFHIITALFTMTIVLMFVVLAITGEYLPILMIGRLILIFTLLMPLVMLKIYLTGAKWAQDKPYVLMNIIFMPFFYLVAVMGLFAFNEEYPISYILVVTPVFLITFTILQILIYIRKKIATDKLNDALNEYHKEHLENGEKE
ncbi:MAG: hypothetical protein J5786_03220 [Clostridiales bacterium]|nr:hypothetical protein [Clostridiales bacterium]